jgi:tRNA-dihydrouridine synthase
MNFWKQLSKPFFVLAPMDDVTDTSFRRVVAQAAPADVYFTEFTSVDGLMSQGGHLAVERRLKFDPAELERPLVAQIWGLDLDNYKQTAEDLVRRGFSGIDINMGCPVKDVIKKGCCSALINNPTLAAQIIAAVKAGAGDLPVSVKTRIGFHDITTEEWIGFLLRQDVAAITIHARTTREQSKVPAHWDEVAKAVKLRDELAPDTLIIGNGDVRNREHGLELAKETGADGIMIGRGVFHDLFAFDDEIHDPSELFDHLLRHLDLYEEAWEGTKPYDILKKFFKIYVNGFPGASDLRVQLMETKSADEAREVLSRYPVPTGVSGVQ